MRNVTRLFKVAQRGVFWFGDYSRTLATLERLANAVNDYDGDIDWEIGEDCSLDSLLVGAYWFCVDYHGGQWSDEYRLQCAIGNFFDPKCSSLELDSSEYDVYTALAVLGGHEYPGDCDDVA